MTGAMLAQGRHEETSMHWLRRAFGAAVLVLLAFLAGCATVPPDAGPVSYTHLTLPTTILV